MLFNSSALLGLPLLPPLPRVGLPPCVLGLGCKVLDGDPRPATPGHPRTFRGDCGNRVCFSLPLPLLFLGDINGWRRGGGGEGTVATTLRYSLRISSLNSGVRLARNSGSICDREGGIRSLLF